MKGQLGAEEVRLLMWQVLTEDRPGLVHLSCPIPCRIPRWNGILHPDPVALLVYRLLCTDQDHTSLLDVPDLRDFTMHMSTIYTEASIVNNLNVGRIDSGRNVFVQMLHAVTYLHQQNVWHRDLKSSNVLFSHQYGQRVIKVHNTHFHPTSTSTFSHLSFYEAAERDIYSQKPCKLQLTRS